MCLTWFQLDFNLLWYKFHPHPIWCFILNAPSVCGWHVNQPKQKKWIFENKIFRQQFIPLVRIKFDAFGILTPIQENLWYVWYFGVVLEITRQPCLQMLTCYDLRTLFFFLKQKSKDMKRSMKNEKNLPMQWMKNCDQRGRQAPKE